MIHKKMLYTYVGIDSHKDTHTAVFLDCFYERIGEITFNNLPSRFEDFLSEANNLCLDGTSLLFGLEDTTAYGRMLTVFLTDHDYEVKHVNALLVAGERKNQNVVEKTDSVDAECAARVLLNKLDILPVAKPQDEYFILRSLVIRRQFIVKNMTALKNHLHTLIMPHYPQYNRLFKNIDCNSSLGFLERYPSPQTLSETTVTELAEFLYSVSAKNFGMEKAVEILTIIKENGDTTLAFQETRDFTVQSTVRQIRQSIDEMKEIEHHLATFYKQFNCTLTSMNGIDVITATQILSCIGDITKFSTSAKLARYAGIAPVSYSSGKHDIQFANQRGNRELNSLLYNLAVRLTSPVSGKNKVINPFFYEYYQRKLSEGKTKGQALKCVQRRLVSIIWSMLTYEEDYINPPMYNITKEGKE